MLSRLVLVGMVAALGITVPTRLEILGWIKAAHSWTASRLADWDSCKPGDDEVIVAPMRPWTPIDRKPDAVTSFEPIVADDRASGLAHELNRRAEGLDISIEPAVIGRRLAVGTTGPVKSNSRPKDFGPLLAGDTVDEKLAMLWFRAVEGSEPAGAPTTLPVTERRPSVAIPPISCTFSMPSTDEGPARQIMTAPVPNGSPIVASASDHDLIAPPDDAVLDLARELNRLAEGIDGSGLSGPVAEARIPAFVPIDPGPALESGLAHELNRASEGLAIVQVAGVSDDSRKTGSLVQGRRAPEASDEGEEGTPPEPPSDVGIALRLTREAVHAWVNVLSGPTTVRMSAR